MGLVPGGELDLGVFLSANAFFATTTYVLVSRTTPRRDGSTRSPSTCRSGCSWPSPR